MYFYPKACMERRTLALERGPNGRGQQLLKHDKPPKAPGTWTQKRELFAALSHAHVSLGSIHSPLLFCKSPSWKFLTWESFFLCFSWQNAHMQLQRICFSFSQHLSFKSISETTKQNKNLRIFQKWKPSLIKVKEVGGYNSFVKPLKVRRERVPKAGKVGNASGCSSLGNLKACLSGVCLQDNLELIKRCAEPSSLWWPHIVCQLVVFLLLSCWRRKALTSCLSPPSPLHRFLVWMPPPPSNQATGLERT